MLLSSTCRFYSDGTLFFYGSGDMWSSDDKIPETVTQFYHEYMFDANSLVMAPGITGIADYAFFECSNLRSVTLPASLETIGDRAFCYCGLQEFTLPEGLEHIGEEAFYGCEFTSEQLFKQQECGRSTIVRTLAVSVSKTGHCEPSKGASQSLTNNVQSL